jgi:microcystin-dependent protein
MTPYIGTIVLFPYVRLPLGYQACDGRQLPRKGNEALATALGTTGETISLPNLVPPVPNLQYAMAVTGTSPTTFRTAAATAEPFIGTIALQAADVIPDGWMPCEGQVLPVSQQLALFELLENRFGGDGRITFFLPDLRDKAPAANLRYFMRYRGPYPYAQ